MSFFRRLDKQVQIPALELYRTAVAQARRSQFYTEFAVPDTVDGRFDAIALHVFLILHRLKQDGAGRGDLAQALFDIMFADMDLNLREMGVGDLSVGKKVKKMAEGFNGRALAYGRALADGNGRALETALRRNLYGTVSAPAAALAAMAAYVHRESKALARQDSADIAAGRVRFGAPDRVAPSQWE